VKRVRVVNQTRGREVGSNVGMADSWWGRLRGLIGRPRLQAGEGLLLCPCKAVHMYGVRYPIDVAFLDREGAVVALYRELAPGARSRWHDRARCALELPPGMLAASGTQVGDILAWSAAGPDNGPEGRAKAKAA
jgi:uncharacterized membrane protein (UPF0127 family)